MMVYYLTRRRFRLRVSPMLTMRRIATAGMVIGSQTWLFRSCSRMLGATVFDVLLSAISHPTDLQSWMLLSLTACSSEDHPPPDMLSTHSIRTRRIVVISPSPSPISD